MKHKNNVVNIQGEILKMLSLTLLILFICSSTSMVLCIIYDFLTGIDMMHLVFKFGISALIILLISSLIDLIKKKLI